ncbi:MAG: glycosylase [Planctomycetaceae bacterium]|nr:glycosylase [Planctomycetaceae bacterium]
MSGKPSAVQSIRVVWVAVLAFASWPAATIRIAAQEAATASPPAATTRFPRALVEFTPAAENPVFTAGGAGHWDVKIRERGWILRQGDQWRLWFTGYDGTRPGQKMLGLATSRDGLHWEADSRNPIYRETWCEDMMVVEHDGLYYLFAEGAGDRAQLLTSSDGVVWKRRGTLDVRQTSGEPLTPGPYGTPTAWIENGTWYLFYERGDQGVWLATSRDLEVWRNVQDEPVLARGPEAFDKYAVALNQIIRYNGVYYAYYHGSDTPEWREWRVNVARSKDLVHWEKYPHNPLTTGNQSSGIVVPDGDKFRLYTMHNEVRAYLPSEKKD